MRATARKAWGLSGVALLGSALAIPTTFLVGRWLGPDAYGRTQYVLLFFMYAALMRSGIFEGSVRAFIDHAARRDTDLAQRLQNVGVSYETVVSAIPGLVLLVVGLFLVDPLRREGFLIAPIAVLASSVAAFLGSLYSARSRFDIVAKISGVRAVFLPIATLAGVQLIGAAAVFLAPAAADALTIVLYLTRRPRLGLKPVFDWERAKPLLRTGFPLGAAAVVYWAYRLVGTTSIALWESPAVLGVYAFAAAPIAILARALSSLQAVLTPSVWSRMAAADERDRSWVAEGGRLTLGIAVAAGVVANLSQAGFGPLVRFVVPHFSPAVPLFDILAFNVFLLLVPSFPSLVLDSVTVNRQVRHLVLWIAALGLNAVANVAVLALGLGPRAIAWDDIWVQGLVVLALFIMAAPYVGRELRESGAYRALALTAGVVVLNFLALRLAPNSAASLGQLVIRLIVRCGLVTVTWGLAVAGYRYIVKPKPSPAIE